MGPGEHGFVRADLQPGDKGFGEPVPCPACTGREGYEQARRRKLFDALMAEAAIPPFAREWDFTAFRERAQGDRLKLDALQSVVDWATNKDDMARHFLNVYLWGAFGTGKSGLVISLLKARMHQGQPALYYTLPDLLERIKRTYDRDSGGGTETLLRQLQDVDLLALDDIGVERPTEWVLEKLFQLLDGRMRNERATLYTSNLAPEEMAAHLGERIMQRVGYRTWTLEVGGRNLRESSVALKRIEERHERANGSRR